MGTKLWTFCVFSSFCNSKSLSNLLAAATVVIPDIANFLAIALPIPDDAPVTKATFPFSVGVTKSGKKIDYIHAGS